ncbi:Hypp3037 [Branchiostoma lanceolatum]|uniref:Hypp3037 protein n=1 Tax=Branchiostoma lanceolatum TaxID=7740 RepID=A0A8J9ZZ34_BRALA|nr:Hypp3037 [Branchiostoma lanceolatum]
MAGHETDSSSAQRHTGTGEATQRRQSYNFSDNFNVLSYGTYRKIALKLGDETATENWTDLADKLGYGSMEDISNFRVQAKALQELPAMLLLKEWSRKPGATIQVMVDALTEMERPDVLAIVTEAMEDQFTLHYVVVTAEGDALPVQRVQVFGNDSLETSLQASLAQTGLRTDDLVIQEPDCVEEDRVVKWKSSSRLVKGRQLVLRHKDHPPPSAAHAQGQDMPPAMTSSLSSPMLSFPPGIAVSSPEDRGAPGRDSIGSLEELQPGLDNISVISEDVEWEGSEDLSSICSLPGWHPHLPDRKKYIHEVMAPYIAADGWFLVRPLDDHRLAVSVTFNGGIRHFKIHRTRDDRYYFHRKQRRAESIDDLINIYSMEGLPTTESRRLARAPHPADQPPPLPPRPGHDGGARPPQVPTRDSMVYLKHPIRVDKELEERLKKKDEEHYYKN